MTEQDVSHLIAVVLFVFTLTRLRRGLVDSTSWFAMFFCFAFLGNLLGYPLAAFGSPVFESIRGSGGATLHGRIVVVGMISAWVGHLVVKDLMTNSNMLRNLPRLVSKNVELSTLFKSLTIAGALLSLVMSATGYNGYAIDRKFLENPPAWLDIMRATESIARATLFLVILYDFSKFGKLQKSTKLLMVLWILSGLMAGFKTQVVMPGVFVVLGSWMTGGGVKARHLAVFAGLTILAYSVIEPMRAVLIKGRHESAQSSITKVVSNDDFGMMRAGSVLDQFVRRIDYTRNAVRTLGAYKRGRVSRTQARLYEYHLYIPLLAVIPRALWKGKPLSNIGAVLYTDLTKRKGNSITPSRSVMSFLWGGWLGLVFSAALWGILCTLSGQLSLYCVRDSYAYAPYIVLALVLSSGTAMMASYLIHSIRIVVVIFLLRRIGIVRRV